MGPLMHAQLKELRFNNLRTRDTKNGSNFMGNSIGAKRVNTVCLPSFNGILKINVVLRFMIEQ